MTARSRHEAATRLPPNILARLRQVAGEPLRIEPSHGMSGASVFIVRGPSGAVVLKGSSLQDESRFYRQVAPTLRERGVPIPNADALGFVDARYWLLLEYLPVPLPQQDPAAPPDPRVMDALVTLHAVTRGSVPGAHGTARAEWTPAVTEIALSILSPAVSAQLRAPLENLRQEARALSRPWCWVSGDPSSPNWAARDDGTLMLFDWELFRPGIPAADLAPVAPGLASHQQIAVVAESYADAWTRRIGTPLPWSLDQLVRDTVVARVATVVLVLAESARGEGNIPAAFARGLADAFPAWLRSLQGHLR